ncbi:MAG: hypothetical protein KDA87_06945 [Planctomycetales bacterium]|nr:hypothetical protein [Planctomycetales bacterium]
MNAYEILNQVVQHSIYSTFGDAWFAFEAWERARRFRDDPSAPSKETLEWIRTLHELTVQLDAFQGPGKSSCQAALETVFREFARLDHHQEITNALQIWRDAVWQEIPASKESAGM